MAADGMVKKKADAAQHKKNALEIPLLRETRTKLIEDGTPQICSFEKRFDIVIKLQF